MTADLTALETDVRAAVARRGLRVRRLTLVSPLGARKGARYAYRVDTHDGRSVKARHFGSVDDARRVHELRRGLETAFAPVLERCGAVLIEAWIEGDMLDAAGAEAAARRAGALLGRLHARALPPGTPTHVATAHWSDSAGADIDLLHESRALSAAGRECLAAALRRHDPGRARTALVHKDFCAENMLVDVRGRLRIIDTELIALDPAGFDLAWTWHRWPLSAPGWARFMAGYRSAAPAVPAAPAYWRIVTGLVLARVFHQRMPARLDAQLARLRRCVEDAPAGAPA